MIREIKTIGGSVWVSGEVLRGLADKKPSQFNSADWEAFDASCPHCGTIHSHANACGGDRVLRQPRRPLTHPE